MESPKPSEMRVTFEAFVLVSARTELIFFLVAGIVQCFGFSMGIMLIDNTLMFVVVAK